jgi:hypothetical protein
MASPASSKPLHQPPHPPNRSKAHKNLRAGCETHTKATHLCPRTGKNAQKNFRVLREHPSFPRLGSRAVPKPLRQSRCRLSGLESCPLRCFQCSWLETLNNQHSTFNQFRGSALDPPTWQPGTFSNTRSIASPVSKSRCRLPALRGSNSLAHKVPLFAL